jgi:tryptophan-rich sensory protein
MRIDRLIISIAICQLAGLFGAIFSYPSIPTWYTVLQKPIFIPPSWVFTPVWILLYLLMGIALYLVWDKGLESEAVRAGLLVFGVQLILNVLWSILFFGFKVPLYAFVEIVILWGAILATILKFNRVSRLAAWLLAPYVVWVTFAAFLNFSIYWLNR